MLNTHLRILHEVLALPTAPFAEQYVLAYLDRFCAQRRGVQVTVDAAGNRLLRVQIGRVRVAHPICLAAHLDHPGFVAERMLGRRKVQAVWRGGVRPEYFAGSGVRFYADGAWVRGRITAVRLTGRGAAAKVARVTAAVAGDVPVGAVGMWDLPDPVVRAGRIYARPCDDLSGAAAMLCCLEELTRRQVDCCAYLLFTRAEEVGFVGALAATRLGTIPRRCCVVAVENSSALVHAKVGDGPILRVGDKTAVFTPAVTRHCRNVADGLVARSKGFKYQRRLMDGGTCESTAYCERGYAATGLCLALGNYHNMDVRRKRIAPEYVSLADFENLVAWFVELCRPQNAYTGRDESLATRLGKIETEYGTLLRRTARELAHGRRTPA